MIFDINTYIPTKLKALRVNISAIESAESMAVFLRKYGICKTNDFVFKNLQSYIKAYNNRHFVLPKAYLFNSQNQLIKVLDTPKDLDTIYLLEADVNSSLSYRSLEKLYSEVIDSVKGISFSKEPKIVLTWSVYAGDLNKDYAFAWLKKLNTVKNQKIKVYLLNCDLQDTWDLLDDDFS